MEGSVYQYYANVRTEPVEWLWYPYIPLGKLTVLQGDPGEGKSTFALNVVARITTGQPMPDGVPTKGKRVAIYQCAEDGIADTIKPRLQQAGADCERVAYIIDNDIALTLEDGRIETAIKDTHASVFIIDPIQAFIPPDADMQSATKMRSVLRKLANIADRNKCAVILIGHMNKGGSSKSLYRGLGSIDIAAIARSVLMISRDESRPDIRYMYPIKSSLAPEGPANITRLDNALEGLPKRLEMNEMELDNLKKQFETAKVDVERPFPQEEELKAKTDRLNELNALLNVDKRENEIVGGEPDEGEEPPEKKPRDLER